MEYQAPNPYLKNGKLPERTIARCISGNEYYKKPHIYLLWWNNDCNWKYFTNKKEMLEYIRKQKIALYHYDTYEFIEERGSVGIYGLYK